MPGCNRTRYNYLLLASFVCLFVCLSLVVLSGLGIALTIPSEVRAVQDRILPLMNHALTFDYSSGPILLDHLELRLDLLSLSFITKPTAYW